MIRFFRHVMILMLFASFVIVHAQDHAADSPFRVTVNSDFRSFSDNEHVYVDASVTNISSKTEKFYRFEIPYTTFQPIMYDMSGREAETRVDYRQDNHTADQMVKGSSPRVITLAPSETFTVRLNLADYYDIEVGRKYRVRLLFLPDASNRSAQATKNIYTFSVNPEVYNAVNSTADRGANSSGGIRPGEVVQLFLSAEKNESWNDYLKYIDEEEYIFSFPSYAGKYVGAPEVVQNHVLEEFKTYLIRFRPDSLLEFEILGETIAANSAKVKVRASRQAARQPFVYVYTFSLEKYSAYWKITGIEATLSRKVQR